MKCPVCKSTLVTKPKKDQISCKDCGIIHTFVVKGGSTSVTKSKPATRHWKVFKGFIPKEKEDYGPQY